MQIMPGTLTGTRQDQDKWKINFATSQSCGKIREHNEDALYAILSESTSGEEYHTGGLFLVADGMGGHENGERASKIAAETFISVFLDGRHPANLIEVTANIVNIEKRILEATLAAHTRVAHEIPGSGTTFTAAWVSPICFTLVHVGDTRAYLIDRKGNTQLITKDHSLVQRLVDIGQIPSKKAAVDPRRNILLRALGQLEPLEPDISQHEFNKDTVLLICSDGLWGVVKEERIRKIILSTNDLERAAQELVKSANHAGGPDNISVILVERK